MQVEFRAPTSGPSEGEAMWTTRSARRSCHSPQTPKRAPGGSGGRCAFHRASGARRGGARGLGSASSAPGQRPATRHRPSAPSSTPGHAGSRKPPRVWPFVTAAIASWVASPSLRPLPLVRDRSIPVGLPSAFGRDHFRPLDGLPAEVDTHRMARDHGDISDARDTCLLRQTPCPSRSRGGECRAEPHGPPSGTASSRREEAGRAGKGGASARSALPVGDAVTGAPGTGGRDSP